MPTTKKKTPKNRTKKPVKSNKQPAKLARSVAPADPGEAAYARLKLRLAKIPADKVAQPRTDLRAAASFVLSNTVARLKDRTLRARFATLPAAEFDHSAIEDLGDAAQAALWAQAQLAEALAGVPGTRLPVELLNQASALRGRMLDICAYHFRQDARLSAQTDDIRSGQGYLDLAEDLRRLAALYRSERQTLKQDLRFYRAADEGDALKLSQRIVAELRTTGPQAARESAWRSWALLNQLYEEVARGGRFLLRDDATIFPSLHTVGRSAPRSSKKSPAAPTPAPPAPPCAVQLLPRGYVAALAHRRLCILAAPTAKSTHFCAKRQRRRRKAQVSVYLRLSGGHPAGNPVPKRPPIAAPALLVRSPAVWAAEVRFLHPPLQLRRPGTWLVRLAVVRQIVWIL